jgi:nicotinamidase-related amidase
MPLTALDPGTALIVIDLQKGILSFPMAHPSAPVLDKARRLARAFRAKDLPVVLVNVATTHPPGRTDSGPMGFTPPPDWTDLAPELEPRASDIRITKQQWGGFHATALDLELRRRGVTQVALCGIATSIGVDSTARDAYEHGYNVTLVVDAMTDLTTEAHEHAIARIFPRLGETGTTDALLALLQQRR